MRSKKEHVPLLKQQRCFSQNKKLFDNVSHSLSLSLSYPLPFLFISSPVLYNHYQTLLYARNAKTSQRSRSLGNNLPSIKPCNWGGVYENSRCTRHTFWYYRNTPEAHPGQGGCNCKRTTNSGRRCKRKN